MNSLAAKPSWNEDLIEVINALALPSPNEIQKEQLRIKDITAELKKKRKLKDKFLQKACGLELQLNHVHSLLQERHGDPLLYAISVLLEDEKAYNEDQASRTHVEREEKRLSEAKRYLRLLIMKRALADATSKL